MDAYTQPIATAAAFFPFVALLITLPYMVFEYRRHGAVLILRAMIIYSFILYCMCAYFLTMLPLPDVETVRKLTTPRYQLIPGRDIVRWLQNSHVVLSQPATWKTLLNRDLFQLVANIVMLVPMGIYLRYYFRCSLKKTVLISFGVSLLFELTQLSGLFFIYPRPYRLADVNDLITNTLGGFLGYLLAGPLMRILPTHERMDQVAYHRSKHVSVTRRVTAAVVDWIIIFLFVIVLSTVLSALHISFGVPRPALLPALYGGCVFLYFMLGEWLWKGKTPGKRLMRFKLVDDRSGGRPRLWQCVVRYGMLYIIVAPLPLESAVLLLFIGNSEGETGLWQLILSGLLLLLFAAFLIWLLVKVLLHSKQLPHGELSKTRNVSTLRRAQAVPTARDA